MAFGHAFNKKAPLDRGAFEMEYSKLLLLFVVYNFKICVDNVVICRF